MLDDAVQRDTPAARPTSRRGVLAAGASGLAGLLLGALGRPGRAGAAAGSPLIMGSASNSAGTSSTSLTTASSGTALLVTQTGAGTALRGSATAVDGIAGFFTSANGPGVSGVTANKDKHAVYAGHNAAATGAGAALRAQGGQNSAVVATTAAAGVPTVKAINSAVGTAAGQGPAVLGLASAGATTDIHPSGYYLRAAGEFAGPAGVIGAASTEYDQGIGVIGLSSSTTRGWGVYGEASGATGGNSGVYGVAASTDADTSGVLGYAYGASGSVYGVYGTTPSTGLNASGVRGSSGSPTGSTNGVWGEVSSGDGFGVYGYAFSATGSPHGVHGHALANGYALYGDGRAYVGSSLEVVSTLSKGGGSFKIDHPLDPANKYLYHSFVESPDMKNVYDGVATLDAKGEAVVAMPDWFEALNRDFRYQLTALDTAAPGLHVKSRLLKGAFTIAGGAPGQAVSWQLTGIRQDAFANANRVEVEVAKSGTEKGRYLHPEAHGKPSSAGIAAASRRPASKTSRASTTLPGRG